jgi:hypothetical protein
MTKLKTLDEVKIFAKTLPGVLVGEREHYKQRRGSDFITISVDQRGAHEEDRVREYSEVILVITRSSSGRYSISKRSANTNAYKGVSESLSQCGVTHIAEDVAKYALELQAEIENEINQNRATRIAREDRELVNEELTTILRHSGFGSFGGYSSRLGLVDPNSTLRYQRSSVEYSSSSSSPSELVVEFRVKLDPETTEERVKAIREFADKVGIELAAPQIDE